MATRLSTPVLKPIPIRSMPKHQNTNADIYLVVATYLRIEGMFDDAVKIGADPILATDVYGRRVHQIAIYQKEFSKFVERRQKEFLASFNIDPEREILRRFPEPIPEALKRELQQG